MNFTGTPIYSSMKLMYAFASSGSSSNVLQSAILSSHPPLSSLYTGFALLSTFKFVVKSSVTSPFTSYPVHTFIVSNLPIVSRWFTDNPVSPLRRLAYLSVTRSSHPHLLGRPVVVPYSCPSSRILSPVSSSSSVTYGPSPTRLEYAFMTPYTFPISDAESPCKDSADRRV